MTWVPGRARARPAARVRNGPWFFCAPGMPRLAMFRPCLRPAGRRHCENCCAARVRGAARHSEKLLPRDRANRRRWIRGSVRQVAGRVLAEHLARCGLAQRELRDQWAARNVTSPVRDRGAGKRHRYHQRLRNNICGPGPASLCYSRRKVS